MRHTQRIIVAIAILVSLPAYAQVYMRDTDTLFRAAYCLGVLKSVLAAGPAEAAERCKLPAELKKFSSAEECVNSLLTEDKQRFQSKHQRYFDYIAISRVQLPSDLLLQLGLIIRKGERDYGRHQPPDSEFSQMLQCSTGCPAGDGLNQCIIDCTAKFDQTLANVQSCLSLPDRLPF